MNIGDKVIFIGQNYNIAKIFNYNEIFKNKELIVENIIKCSCDKGLNKIKIKNIEGYYNESMFKKEKDKYENFTRTYE